MLRLEVLKALASASALLRSVEIEQSVARGPLEEVEARLEAVALLVGS